MNTPYLRKQDGEIVFDRDNFESVAEALVAAIDRINDQQDLIERLADKLSNVSRNCTNLEAKYEGHTHWLHEPTGTAAEVNGTTSAPKLPDNGETK